jgi:small-conductance mechanosensitive channel
MTFEFPLVSVSPAEFSSRLRHLIAAFDPHVFLERVLDDLEEWLIQTDFSVLLIKLVAALLLGALVYAALSLIRRLMRRRIEALRAAPQTDLTKGRAFVAGLNGIIAATSSLFMWITAIAAGSHVFTFTSTVRSVIDSLFVVAFVLQGAVWASVGLGATLEHFARRRGDGRSVQGATSIIELIGRAVLWSVALLLVLDNLGINVTALVAGLGIGGIAIGLAAQSILGDLFASLSIVLDKPFEVGDFVITGEYMGTVERIGLKTTRLRSLSGEQIVISNADLLASRIRNYKRMAERRVVFTVAVVYGTPHDKLAMIPQMIRAVIEAEKRTRFDRCHFAQFADFALSFETAYYVLSADYNEHMDTLQAINLAIYKRFTEEGISFALRAGSVPAPMVPAAAAQR